MVSSKATEAVLAALRATGHDRPPATAGVAAPPKPFVTISRQAGVGGRSLALMLVERLNAVDPGPLPWTLWDNEIVQRVVAEQHLPEERVRALEEHAPTWFEECLAGLALAGPRDAPEELVIYHRVAAVIRSLAELGRVVILGRGGAFITEDLKGGVHLRLVAPLEHRVARLAEVSGMRREAAAEKIRETDERRTAFYHRHWPKRRLAPEEFTATYNTAAASPRRLIHSALPLVLAMATDPGPGVVGDASARRPVVAAEGV